MTRKLVRQLTDTIRQIVATAFKTKIKPAITDNGMVLDFGRFTGLIGSNKKWQFADIDVFLERKGKFLFGEYKTYGAGIPTGQEISIKALSSIPNSFVFTAEHTRKRVKGKLKNVVSADAVAYKIWKDGKVIKAFPDNITKELIGEAYGKNFIKALVAVTTAELIADINGWLAHVETL